MTGKRRDLYKPSMTRRAFGPAKASTRNHRTDNPATVWVRSFIIATTTAPCTTMPGCIMRQCPISSAFEIGATVSGYTANKLTGGTWPLWAAAVVTKGQKTPSTLAFIVGSLKCSISWSWLTEHIAIRALLADTAGTVRLSIRVGAVANFLCGALELRNGLPQSGAFNASGGVAAGMPIGNFSNPCGSAIAGRR